MPLPDGVATVTLTAVFPPLSPDGTDRQGTAAFTPVPPVLVDPGGIYLGPENATIGASGMHVNLVATDALDEPFIWRMDLALTGQPPISRNISLPASAGTVSLGTVLEVEALPTDYVVVIGPRGPQGADGGASGPTGPAGGALAGTYPDPTLSASSVALFDAAGAAASAQAAAISTAASDATTKANAAQAAAISTAASDATSKVGTHEADTTSVHGIADTAVLETQSGATGKVSTHVGAADPHGDRAWADTKFATQLDLSTLNGTVNSLSIAVSSLDVFVNDCLTRVAAIEQGTAYLNGGHFTAPVDISEGGLTVTSSGTAIIVLNRGTTSNFGGFALTTGTVERWAVQMLNDGSNDLFVTDTANGVHALHVTPHPTTPTVAIAGVAAAGSKNGLTGVRLAGFKATSGAPTTDTWVAGDVVLDSAGAWHLCTAGGTPGTWT
jgi:hypothetical protein